MALAIQTSTQSDIDFTWLQDVRQAALDSLMPLESSSEQLVAYRGYRSVFYEVPERHFSISSTYSGFGPNQLTATVIVPAGSSIQQQLVDLHQRERRSSIHELVARVAVRRLTFSAEQCPAIRWRLDALSDVALSFPDRDVIVLQPVVHDFVFDLGGTHIDARNVGGNTNALVRWANETLDAIVACAG
jgi:hypothetical protein